MENHVKRLIVDMSSVMKRALFAGKDKEFGREVEFNGKKHFINSASYGYDITVGMLNGMLDEFGIPPMNMILVHDGMNGNAMRRKLYPEYKAKREERPPAWNAELNELRRMLDETYTKVGAIVCHRDETEADDLIAFLAKNLQGTRIIASSDGDLAALIGDGVSLFRNGAFSGNPYGPFPCKYVPLYKALVGDSSDNISGVVGFGEKAFLDMYALFGDDGLEALYQLFEEEQRIDRYSDTSRGLGRLVEDVAEFKPLKKILEQRQLAIRCYVVGSLHPEWATAIKADIQWKVGMPLKVEDSRFSKWNQKMRVVTASNYQAAREYLASQVSSTPFFTLDLETTVGTESDEWLGLRGGKGVDVIGSRIVSCALSFGSNTQIGLYVSVNHRDTDNVTLDQLRELLELIPKDKLTVAHNTAGFELPVMFNAWGDKWKGNGWRGFFPNMVDTRIAASYWDENQPTHGLKALSKVLLGYEQTTYDQVTQGRKMDEMTAQETLDYGVDDVYTASALWNFFRMFMELEGSFRAFMEFEQKPMYLTAMSYVEGIRMDTNKLHQLSKDAAARYVEHEKVLHAYLIERGWEGTQCPVFTSLDAAAVKLLVLTLLGIEMKTMVRTVSKLAILVRELEHDNAGHLASLIESNDLAEINRWMAREFDGRPKFDVSSPKQVSKLVYDVMGLPVRLRNKVTPAARAKGVREGTAKTDDDALGMAIKMGDVMGDEVGVLKALLEMKAIKTAQGLYFEPYPKFVHWKTGRVHPELRQSSTVTRRYTSANPNVQQLDSTYGGIRSVIVPHKRDAVVVSLDFSGQELRAMADLSKDISFLACYIGSKDQLRDVHSMVGCAVANESYEDFYAKVKSKDPEISGPANKIRQIAKIVNFSTLYGSSAKGVAATLMIQEEEAQRYIDALFSQFPGVEKWKTGVEESIVKSGFAQLMHGTRRHLAKAITGGDNYEISRAKRQGPNAAIQSSCALQTKRVMTDIWNSDIFERFDAHWYMSVHDEIVMSIAREDAVACLKELHETMTRQFLETIPSASSIGLGKSFGELIELGEVFDASKVEAALVDIFAGKD